MPNKAPLPRACESCSAGGSGSAGSGARANGRRALAAVQLVFVTTASNVPDAGSVAELVTLRTRTVTVLVPDTLP